MTESRGAIRVSNIDPGVRRREDYGDIARLAASIKRLGLLHPLTVTPRNGRFLLVLGARRLKAIQLLKMDFVDVRVLDPVSEEQLREMEIQENDLCLEYNDREKRAVATKEATHFAASERHEMKELKVHPAADIFPMLGEDELADLAADIKANGLAFPIVLDGEVLIDGRNRLAACKLAGVEPRFEPLNGRDPLAFIASANLKRRNLTKGQQAMALAMIYPEPEKGGRGKKSEAVNSAESAGFSQRRLNEARAILRHSPELAKSVLAGLTPFEPAQKKVELEQEEEEGDRARMDRLLKGAPDLAVRVADEELTLDEATAIFEARETRRRHTYQTGVRAVSGLASDLAGLTTAILGADEARAESEPPIVIPPETLALLDEFVLLLRGRQFNE